MAPTSACEVASLGVQVHGGMGFVEETGAAQHYRDIRIAPIYEGTNGIQAADLVGRKLGLEGGAVLRPAARRDPGGCGRRGGAAGAGRRCEAAAEALLGAGAGRPAGGLLSVPDHALGRGLRLADEAPAGGAGRQTAIRAFAAMKRAAARFYLDQVVPEARGLKAAATAGATCSIRSTRTRFAA